ncbi:MAG: alpha-L-rhamnosidase C-terminal domain-containing protein [Candidatus Merdivicinus sp.]|jgi:alpha-L-rhamnosidase
MAQRAKWIWLDENRYPLEQSCAISSANGGRDFSHYCMAEFRKEISFRRDVVSAEIRVSGDTFFRLYCNEEFVGIGPVAAGGDFGHNLPMKHHFANRYHVDLSGKQISFLAQVQIPSVVISEWSQGHGGFYLEADIRLEDGSHERIVSDESWEVRRNGCYAAPYRYDQRIKPDGWETVQIVSPVWNLTDAPIPMLSMQEILPQGAQEFVVGAGEERTFSVEFDRIYAGYLLLKAETAGECEITVHFRELTGKDSSPETLILTGNMNYSGFQMHSIGGLDISVCNRSASPAILRPAIRFSCYPVEVEGKFSCSDLELTKVWEVCKWALQICRQTLHLDSPRHQEPLACTGDYYIESLMTAYTFGDMRLARLDVLRTAERLMLTDGWMFHTTYSLIWVQMLWDVYQYNDDLEMVRNCLPALRALLKRFHSYTDDNGVITAAPNYMFIDWIVVDGYSMHHPPKALGQTALNAFYYGALRTAVRLLEAADDPKYRQFIPIYRQRAEQLYHAFSAYFYDEEQKLYFDGQDTPEPALKWRPANINRRYFSRHSNVLAVLYGLCEPAEGRRILEEVLERKDLPGMQPYFMHFVFEAVWKMGLFSRYGLELLQKWIPMVETCDKGLQEGWLKPEEGYSFDYSHAWGGTPAYQLPSKLLGLEMLEPGYGRIRLVPRLYGLKWAKIEVPTPYGKLYCRMEEGKDPIVIVPEEIKAEIC